MTKHHRQLLFLFQLIAGFLVYYFIFFPPPSGLVGMMERSGGMLGFTRDVSIWATAPRSGQFCCFAIGCFVFFDDYANVLLAGETMRPLLDTLSVSREKLAFIVDATAAPVASISPVSSWGMYHIPSFFFPFFCNVSIC